MRLSALLLGWLLLLPACSEAEPQTEGLAQPAGPVAALAPGLTRVRVTPLLRKLGEVWQGAVLDTSFELEVLGPEALRIEKVQPGCGCTVAELALLEPDGRRQALEPGQALAVGARVRALVHVDTHGRVGPLPREITIYANTETGRVVLELEASVRPFLVLEPALVNFGQVPWQQGATARAAVRSPSGMAFGLSARVDAPDPPLQVRATALAPERDGRSSQWELELSLAATALPGIQSWRLVLSTDVDNPDARRLDGPGLLPHGGDLWVHADVRGPLNAQPAALSFGVVRRGTLAARSLRLSASPPGTLLERPTLELFGAQEGEPFAYPEAVRLTLRAQPAGPAQTAAAWDVELALDQLPGHALGPFDGWLRVDCGAPGGTQQRLWVAVSGNVAPGR